LISIVLALVSLLISEWLARLAASGWGNKMLELHFTQTLGNHCLRLMKRCLPAASPPFLASPARGKPL
jgi:hypothetical protein